MPRPTVVAFAAPSGTGKTTLICKLLETLRARGHRVGAIKSDAHRVELDEPGKDTHRMRESGAETTALVSRDQVAIFRDVPGQEFPLAGIVELFFTDMDIVLAEGFRSHDFPTIVLRRREISLEGWAWPSGVVAVVSDSPHDGAPVIALDDVAGLTDLVCRLHDGTPAVEAVDGAS